MKVVILHSSNDRGALAVSSANYIVDPRAHSVVVVDVPLIESAMRAFGPNQATQATVAAVQAALGEIGSTDAGPQVVLVAAATENAETLHRVLDGYSPDVVQAEGDGQGMADKLRSLLGLDQEPVPHTNVETESVLTVATEALERAGVSRDDARTVAAALVENEEQGYRSHGLLRVCQYVEDIRIGDVDPKVRPLVTRHTDWSATVDANFGFGRLALQTVADAIRDIASGSDVAVVTLRRAAHVGRLAPLGAELASEGLLVLGFVNCLGHARRVAPAGFDSGAIATNPMLFAAPVAGGSPIVMDMSTSRISEGAVRERLLKGYAADPGTLLRRDGTAELDPAALYEEAAVLAPMAAGEGRRGFVLGLMVEILAGATGGHHIGKVAPLKGNGGFFLAIRAESLGANGDGVASEARSIIDAVLAAQGPNSAVFRVPGTGRSEPTGNLSIPIRLWEDLKSLSTMGLS